MKYIYFTCKMEMCKTGNCSRTVCPEPEPELEPEPEPELDRENIRLNWIAQCESRLENKSSDA